MSREIPMDRPLTDEDRDYLMHRGMEERVTFIDGLHSDVDPETVDTPPVRRVAASPPVIRVGDADTVGEEVQSDEEYEVWTVAELRSELRERGLNEKGHKDELVARLHEHDASAV